MKIIRAYKNILVFNPAFLGDTVLTTPLIRALKKLYPECAITFCVRPEHKALFTDINIVDKVIVYDKRDTAKGLSGIIRFASEINSYKFDLIINLHKSLRSSLLFALVRGSYIIGFKSAKLSFLFNASVIRQILLCEPERNLMLLQPLLSDFTLDEAKKIGGRLSCYIDEKVKNNATGYFKTVSGDKYLVGIAPGSVWRTKRYPPEYFARVAEILYGAGFAIALFGASSDASAVDEFKAAFSLPYYDFAFKTSLSELPALLSATDIIICNDSGPLHMAIAGGTPCVAVFGPTVKALGFFPYDDDSIVVENQNIDCRPCGKHGSRNCPKGHFKCMLDIEPAKVADAVFKIAGGLSR